MKSYKIISPYDFLAISQNNQTFVEAGQVLEMQESTLLSIYPTNAKNKIAFTLNPSTDNDSNFFLSVVSDDQKYFYLTQGMSLENFAVSTLSINNNECKFEIGQDKLTISYSQYKKVLVLQKKFDKYQVGSMANFAYILFTSKEEQNLILFDTKSGQIKMLSGDQIKLTTSSILLNKNLDNIARHILEEEYLVTNDGLVKKTNSLQYQNGRAVIATSAQVIPYAFLEALSLEDLELAKSYLDLSMRRQVDDEHLKEYFGKITAFYPISTNTYLVKTNEGKKIYKFILADNKISEIEN